VLNGDNEDSKRIRGDIDDGLDAAAAALDGSGPDFYAVGGAWRAFAHLAMALDQYPLTLLHQYALSVQQLARAADFAMAQSEASLNAMGLSLSGPTACLAIAGRPGFDLERIVLLGFRSSRAMKVRSRRTSTSTRASVTITVLLSRNTSCCSRRTGTIVSSDWAGTPVSSRK